MEGGRPTTRLPPTRPSLDASATVTVVRLFWCMDILTRAKRASLPVAVRSGAVIGIDRRLQTCSDAEIREICGELLWLLASKGIVCDADLEDCPPTYRRRVEEVRNELRRRGVQLALW
jgi:hypothetical protein